MRGLGVLRMPGKGSIKDLLVLLKKEGLTSANNGILMDFAAGCFQIHSLLVIHDEMKSPLGLFCLLQ